MFEPFTAEALRTVLRARAEAESLNHHWMGTEHVLLALTKPYPDDMVAARQILRQIGVADAAIRSEVLEIIPPNEASGEAGEPQPTPRLRYVLRRSVQLAAAIGHTHVGTEHLLLGLLWERGGIAGQILRRHGVAFEPLLERVRRRQRTDETVPPERQWPLVPVTSGAARIPELAHQQAVHNGAAGRVGTQHHLLALMAESDGLAAKALESFGITYDVLKERLAEIGVAGTADAPERLQVPGVSMERG